MTEAGGFKRVFELPHLRRFAIVKRAFAHHAQVWRAPGVRPPAQELQLVVWFGEHPPIGHGEIADATRLHYAADLEQVPVLRISIADVLDDVVGDHHIEAGVVEGQLGPVNLPPVAAVVNQAIVDHVDTGNIAL